MLTSEQKIYIMRSFRSYGDRRIERQLRKGIKITDDMYQLAYDLEDLFEDMVYMIELDHAHTKEFSKINRNYRQCCRIILKAIKNGRRLRC